MSGWGARRGGSNKGDTCSDRTVLYLDCMKVNVLVVILYIVSKDGTVEGNWINTIQIFLYYFLQLYVNLQLSQNLKA